MFHTSIIICATSNCIYLIACKNCPIQYVRETSHTLRNCFNLHWSSVFNSQKFNHCKIICDHYQTGICKPADDTIQIIEALPENTTAAVCQKKETKWMLKLWTAYPYDLSDNIGEEHHIDSNIKIGIGFPLLKRNIQDLKKSRS